MKVMISIHEDLLKEIDRAAGRERRSRSEFIREAVRFYLRSSSVEYERPLDNPVVREAFERLDRLDKSWKGRWKSEELVRKIRNRS